MTAFATVASAALKMNPHVFLLTVDAAVVVRGPVPNAPSASICTAPSCTVMPPEKSGFAVASTSVPAPVFVSRPAPEITPPPEYVTVTPDATLIVSGPVSANGFVTVWVVS